MRLIHLTDPHLSSLDGERLIRLRGKRRSGYLSWSRNRRHVHRREILEHLTDAVLSQEPDLVLLTGDLVHIGLEREMAEASDWLQRLGPPEKVLLIPGNHDNYAKDSLAAMNRHWGEYLPLPGGGNDYAAGYPVIREIEGLRLIGVNSSCITRIFSAAGELGQQQRQRLAEALERQPGDGYFRCLLIHHPPLPGMTRQRKALRDAVQLQDLVSRSAPELVLYGHIHCNREDILGHSRIYCTASASSVRDASYRVFDLDQDETGWNVRMRLMTLDEVDGENVSFSLSQDSRWRCQAF